MNLAFQINLMQKIELQPEVSEQVLRAFQTHKRQIAWIIKRASLKNCMPFYLVLKLNRKKGALICLAAALAIAERTYAQYKKWEYRTKFFTTPCVTSPCGQRMRNGKRRFAVCLKLHGYGMRCL